MCFTREKTTAVSTFFGQIQFEILRIWSVAALLITSIYGIVCESVNREENSSPIIVNNSNLESQTTRLLVTHNRYVKGQNFQHRCWRTDTSFTGWFFGNHKLNKIKEINLPFNKLCLHLDNRHTLSHWQYVTLPFLFYDLCDNKKTSCWEKFVT